MCPHVLLTIHLNLKQRPRNGEKEFFGEFLVHAQGEDGTSQTDF